MCPATAMALPRRGPLLAPQCNQQIVRHAFSEPLTGADEWGRREPS